MLKLGLGRWLPLLLAALLAGCGWHLRGAVTLPPMMQTIYLKGTNPHGPLGTDIATALAGSDARLVDSQAASGAVLHILGEQFNRRVLTVNRQGKVSEYELHYDVRYRLESRDGKVLMPEQRASAIRSYSFNPNNVLGSGGEEDLLRQEMRSAVVDQMLRRLQAVAATLPTKDGTTQDGTTQDGTTQDGTTQDGTTQDGTTQDGTTQDGTTQDGTTQDGTTQDGTTQDQAGQGK